MSNPAGGLLLLLISIFLLVQFFAGNLDWLFRLGSAIDAAQQGSSPAPAAPAIAGPTPPQLSLMYRQVS